MIPPRKGKPWPWNTIREPRPADWGFGMTVCIAAHCFREQCFVMMTDMMITTADMSSDMATMKNRAVGDSWLAMFAGSDISLVDPILDRVNELVQSEQKPESAVSVRNAFTKAYQEQITTQAENEILKPIGYTFEEFKKDGLIQLGSEHFSRLLYQIQELTVDVEFLVAGFDSTHHLFIVSAPGKIADYSPLGFWAIGSGQTNALGSLFNCQGLFAADMATVMYRVCEAKFNSENAAGVGKKSIMTVLRMNGVRHNILAQVNDFRPIWEKTRVLQIPADARIKADELWNEMKASDALAAAVISQVPPALTSGKS
jgi:ATP-dependent protease HslVU (ClpYQ) peptidase subunit